MLHRNMECPYIAWQWQQRDPSAPAQRLQLAYHWPCRNWHHRKRWIDMKEGIKLIYSGKEEGGEAQHGVGFLLNRKTAEALIASHLISTQIISIWLSCQGMKATFIQVYAPTADCSNNEINSFYNDLQITLSSIQKKGLCYHSGRLQCYDWYLQALMERYHG